MRSGQARGYIVEWETGSEFWQWDGCGNENNCREQGLVSVDK